MIRVRTTPPGRIYLDFARFPVAQVVQRAGTLTTVRLLDARFVDMRSLGQDGASSARLSVVVTFDESGRIVEQRLGN